MDRSSSTERRQPPSMAELAQMKAALNENSETLTKVMEKHLEQLDPMDRQILKESKETFLNHASGGFWLGASLSVLFMLRGRFMGGGITKGGLPKLYYNNVKGSKGVAPESRLFKIFKGVGAGVGGSLIGLQIGVWTGSRAGKAVLDKRPGVQERATQAMTNAGEEVNRIMNGLNNSNDLSESTDFVPSSSSSSGSEIEGEGREKYYGESEFSNEPSSSTGSSTSRVVGDVTASRWEELRKSKASPPSSWDKLRDGKSREELPESRKRRTSASSSNSAGYGVEGELPEPGSDEMYGREQDKEVQQKEFDAMMERERKGNSSTGFNKDGTWRG